MKRKRHVVSEAKKLVRKKLGNGEPGHDYWHCHRVVQIALKIGKKEKANLLVLELAGWLHDIAIDDDKPNHEKTGAKMARKFLEKQEVNPKVIDQVVDCILRHRFSKNIKPQTLEEKIIQDADKLDALGAMGIARAFLVAGKFRVTVHDPKIKPSFEHYLKKGLSTTTINHFYEKLFKLRGMLHTKTAQQIAKK